MKIIIETDQCDEPVTLERILQEILIMNANVQRLQDDVSGLTSVVASANALIAGLAQQIRDNAEDPAALTAIADQLEASRDSLAQAVASNTPAAEPPASTDTGSSGTDTTGAAEGTTEPTGETGDTSGTGATQTDGTEAGADTATDPIDTTDTGDSATTQSEDGASA